MKVFKAILIIICAILTSMFFFPFEFRALPPEMNTKKLMAAVALVILFGKLVQKRELKMDKSFLYLSILAGLVSICGMASVTYNNTEDYTYATYITSCWVWWGGAYTICSLIRWVHGYLSWRLIVNYLVAVCVFQCFMALAMDLYRPLKLAINAIVLQEDLIFKGNVHRLYGIGAALDVAGSRFSAVLIMLIYMMANSNLQKRWYTNLVYVSSIIFITVAGNMIARTTLIGLVISLTYLGIVTIKQTTNIEHNYLRMWKWFLGISTIVIPLTILSYNSNPQLRKNMRFGFEGFFNYFEKGEFHYDSNETLKGMYVWPDNMKTWIIGDAYFNNPYYSDPHYTGQVTEGFYKNTDVGYLRFIYYFGVIGLLVFSFYFMEVGRTCMRKIPRCRTMFMLLLLLHFIIWAKVATDIFLVFALFLCLDNDNNENYIPDSRNI